MANTGELLDRAFRQMIREEVVPMIQKEAAASEDRIYKRLKNGALSEIRGEMSEIRNVVEAQGRAIEGVSDELTAFRGDFNDFRERMEP